MKRYVAHRIFIDGENVLRNGFIELSESGLISSLRTLKPGEEPHDTKHINGILMSPYGLKLTVGKAVPVIVAENLTWQDGHPVFTPETSFRILD
ncbi:MAG: hypothetical protein J6Y79_04655 [Paludibacteraceae bacterium]|nr:hypothetical protein [Paludibacteraceae bacterium]